MHMSLQPEGLEGSEAGREEGTYFDTGRCESREGEKYAEEEEEEEEA